MTQPNDLGRSPSLFARALRCASQLGAALSAASVGNLVVATVDAYWASRVSTGGVAGVPLVAVDAGLCEPVALIVGAAVFAALLLLDPPSLRDGNALARLLGAASASRARASMSAAAAVGAVGWATACAQLGRFAFAWAPRPLSAAVLAAGGACLAAALVGLAVLGAGRFLEGLLEARTAGPGECERVVYFGLGAAFALLVLGVVTGGTSGQGGPLGIWGVLRRTELDLRPMALGVTLALCAYLGPPLLARRLGLFSWTGALVVLALVPYAAVTMGRLPAETLALERGAPLGSMAVRVLRTVTDRDGDGASAWFGGGDCDDHNPSVGPGAYDVPGNGVDEDCSGADSPIAAARSASAARSKAAKALADAVAPDLNVLFITVDTLRADLGYAGYPKPVSPHLDELAARSVVFERAYSLASYTGKSLGPLLSGKYPSETHRNWGHFNRYGRDDTMVAERLQRAGIHTFGAHAHWYFTPPYGLSRGFETWDVSAVPVGPGHDEDATVTGDKLTDAALRLLAKPSETGRRFFAWIHYFDPHSQYARHPDAPDFGSGQRALYDGEVWFTDQQIGRVLSYVRDQPWGAKTAIIVTSDHGEGFGEHGVWRHGVEVWEELVRVPLIIYVPGLRPHRVPARRSCIDIVPTLLDLFHLPPVVDNGANDFVSGRSLLPEIYAQGAEANAPRDVLVDMPRGPNNDARRALLHGDLKLYVLNEVRFQLFDLAADPGEKVDLSRDTSLMDDMRIRYDATRAELREIIVRPSVPND